MANGDFRWFYEIVSTVGVPVIIFIVGISLRTIRENSKDRKEYQLELNKHLEGLKEDLVSYRESWDDRKESILGLTFESCARNQKTCSMLVGERMENIRKDVAAICKKLESFSGEVKAELVRIEMVRSDAWVNQHHVNSALKSDINILKDIVHKARKIDTYT